MYQKFLFIAIAISSVAIILFSPVEVFGYEYFEGDATITNSITGALGNFENDVNKDGLDLPSLTEVYNGSCTGYPGTFPSATGAEGLGCSSTTTPGAAVQLSSYNGLNFEASLSSGDGVYWAEFHNEENERAIVICVLRSTTWSIIDCPTLEPETAGTRIISNTPNNNEILQNTVVQTGITMGSSWFVSLEDLEALMTIFSNAEEKIRYVLQVCPLNSFPNTTLCFTAIDWLLPTGFETSTSTHLLNESFNGHPRFEEDTDYKLYASLTGANYYNLFGTEFTVNKTTYFTIGSTTASQQPGGLSGTVASTTAANNAINPFIAASSACNPFSGEFSIGGCLVALILPSPGALSENIFIITHSPPWGYVVRFGEIMTGQASSTVIEMPTISYTSATSSIFNGATFEFDPFSFAASTSVIVSATSNQTEPKTVWEIMETPIRLIVYMTLLFMIIHDLTGLKHGSSKKHVN